MNPIQRDDDFLSFPHYGFKSPHATFGQPFYSQDIHYTDHEFLQTISLTIEIRKLLADPPNLFGKQSEEVRNFSLILQDAHVDLHASKQSRNLEGKSRLYAINHQCLLILHRILIRLGRIKLHPHEPDLRHGLIEMLEQLSLRTRAIDNLRRRYHDTVPQSSTASSQPVTKDKIQTVQHQDDHVGGPWEVTTQSASSTPEEVDFSRMTEAQFIEWEKINGVHELNKSDPISVEEAAEILNRY